MKHLYEDTKTVKMAINPITQLQMTAINMEGKIVGLSNALEAEKKSHKETVNIHEMAERFYRLGMSDRDVEITRLNTVINAMVVERQVMEAFVQDVNVNSMDNRDVPTLSNDNPQTPTGWSFIDPYDRSEENTQRMVACVAKCVGKGKEQGILPLTI